MVRRHVSIHHTHYSIILSSLVAHQWISAYVSDAMQGMYCHTYVNSRRHTERSLLHIHPNYLQSRLMAS